MAKDKAMHYAAVLSGVIAEAIEGEDPVIDKEELLSDDNLTHFIHALANGMPTAVYNSLTGDQANQLEFNHIANKLCFQFMNIKDEPKTEEENG